MQVGFSDITDQLRGIGRSRSWLSKKGRRALYTYPRALKTAATSDFHTDISSTFKW